MDWDDKAFYLISPHGLHALMSIYDRVGYALIDTSRSLLENAIIAILHGDLDIAAYWVMRDNGGIFSDIATGIARRAKLGAITHGERNWEKGLPQEDTINHILGHLFMLICGDPSDNHLDAVLWGLHAYFHFQATPK